MSPGGIFRPGMRGYFVPLTAGLALTASTFLPWVVVGGVSMTGVPDVAALWVAGLGAIAAVLAMLSLITRRNSRHPLLIVGLFALGIMCLSWRIMPQTAGERETHVGVDGDERTLDTPRDRHGSVEDSDVARDHLGCRQVERAGDARGGVGISKVVR